nr:MAG TPA: hypothetical protein [Caudoviricetes sp.]
MAGHILLTIATYDDIIILQESILRTERNW